MTLILLVQSLCVGEQRIMKRDWKGLASDSTCQGNKSLKKDLSVWAALFFTLNTLDHLTVKFCFLGFDFWWECFPYFTLLKDKVYMSHWTMIACQQLHRCCEFNDLLYLGQPIQLMDEAKSSRIYCKYILDVVQSWPFFCLCWSSIIMERLPKMRNNNLIGVEIATDSKSTSE